MATAATTIARARRTSVPFHGTDAGERQTAPTASANAPAELRLAILDDDSGFMLVLARRLRQPGWAHTLLAAAIAPQAVAEQQLDGLIVDPTVLGERCWSWLEELCELRSELAIVVCTSPSTVAERVRGLRLGVDDWLTKPCHPDELLARVEAITRSRSRTGRTREAAAVTIGEIEVRPDQFQAFVGDRSLLLTKREYQLLDLLLRGGETAQPRELIYERLWGYEMIRNDRSVDVFVHKLRRKLRDGSPGWSYIRTHHGMGYSLEPELLLPGEVLELDGERAPLAESLAA
jgi:DNA-binding response OmpR family regulator